MLLLDLRKLLPSDPNMKKHICFLYSQAHFLHVKLINGWSSYMMAHSTTVWWTDRKGNTWPDTYHSLVFIQLISLSCWHYISYKMFSKSFLWKLVIFFKRTWVSIWKHITEACLFLRHANWNTNLPRIWGQETFPPSKNLLFSHDELPT